MTIKPKYISDNGPAQSLKKSVLSKLSEKRIGTTFNVQIKGENLHSKCGWTPFEGYDAIFPVATVLRGKPIVKDGELQEEISGQMLSV